MGRASTRQPDVVRVRGARVHNLKDVEVDVPLRSLVGVAGVSGSGKSSLVLGVLYAEGSRRYVEALSTYTRRRMAQAPRAAVDSLEHVPAALALRQRPGVPGVRSTFGTSTELLNVLRLMLSRLASHLCPNGHRAPPTIDVAAETPFTCPVCGAAVRAPGAEALSFNSTGACPRCQGAGVPEEKKHITVPSRKGFHELDFTFRNARLTVMEELRRAHTEKRLVRVSRFLREGTCPDYRGTRLSPAALEPRIGDLDLVEVTAMTLAEVLEWAPGVPAGLPPEMRQMAEGVVEALVDMARRLVELGLGYLALDRAGSTLSTGERQRTQLARALRNRTTGVLYVLDEPSIGLHPANVDGLVGVMQDLLADGNSVIFVDHDVQILRQADWLIEIGPGPGSEGGTIIADGSPVTLAATPTSRLAGFLAGREPVVVRATADPPDLFAHGTIHLETGALHTVHPLQIDLPVGRLTAVTGVSGSGKTTLVLESLVPALKARSGSIPAAPGHVRGLRAPDGVTVHVVDATPIGQNVRSTVATYSGVMDELRKAYAVTDAARAAGLTASDFSYNTGSLACPRCEGTGQVSLDVQFLPDIDIVCPDCEGSRYAPQADAHMRDGITLPGLLRCTVRDALAHTPDLPRVHRRLSRLDELGLGYLTLGEATPALSGGEAQRLKLVSQVHRDQRDAVFVLDEPSVGLHPLDVRTLLDVLHRLTERGATVIVIEHDLDLVANADYMVDLGPGGGEDGGRVIAKGTPLEVARDPASVTGPYLARHLTPA